MTASAPFTAFYSKAMRDILPCLSGQETKVFVAIATHIDQQGKCWPGVRELADVTTYPPQIVCELLESLQEKDLVICGRKAGRDPLTGRMVPDVYAVNPSIWMISDVSVWDAFALDAYTNRNSSIPESTFPVKSAQADRITEADVFKQIQRSRITAPEGAALLSQTRVATRRRTSASGENAGADSTAGSQRQPNSPPQARNPPSSTAPPLVRNLDFAESVAVNAIRREVPDMNHDVAAKLVATYGVEQFTAAVMSMKKRSEKVSIKRPTGWIIQNLKQGARR